MSDTTQKTTPTVVTVAETPETTKKGRIANLFGKVTNFLRSHKKPAIAAGFLLGLLGLATFAARKTAPLPTFEALDVHVDEDDLVEEEPNESDDSTTVA